MNAGTPAAERLRKKVAKKAGQVGWKLPLATRTELVKKRLMSNVCRYRGYVLEGYPETYLEAEALFMEKVKDPEEEEADEANPDEEEEDNGEEENEEEGDDEDEEEPAADPPADDEEEEEDEDKPKNQLNVSIAPEFAVKLNSSRELCKARIFGGTAKGPTTEEEFTIRTNEYHKANNTEDGSPGTGDFFAEVGGVKVLGID